MHLGPFSAETRSESSPVSHESAFIGGLYAQFMQAITRAATSHHTSILSALRRRDVLGDTLWLDALIHVKLPLSGGHPMGCQHEHEKAGKWLAGKTANAQTGSASSSG